MSWARDDNYKDYRNRAARVPTTPAFAKWVLQIWELSNGQYNDSRLQPEQLLKRTGSTESPEGRWCPEMNTASLTTPAKLRIMYVNDDESLSHMEQAP
jgi:hypothetical protein